MNEKVGVSQSNPDPFPAPEYVHLYERPEPKSAIRQNHLVIESISLTRLLEDANKLSIEEDWRVVPGSVQVLNILHHELREGVGRVEMYERRYVLTMQRPDEEVQVVERSDCEWYETGRGSGYTVVRNVLLGAMLTNVISAWPDWRSWPVGAPGRDEMERQEEVYRALLRFVMERRANERL